VGKTVGEVDGKRQRNALTAAERSLQALGAGNPMRAARSAAKAADLDQLGLFSDLPAAVAFAVDELDGDGSISGASWDRLEVAVGPGPLQFLIRDLRG
jgi:hypothetical protein